MHLRLIIGSKLSLEVSVAVRGWFLCLKARLFSKRVFSQNHFALAGKLSG